MTNPQLIQAQREQVNQILEDEADVEVTVEVPGPNEMVLAGETICLEPGQYDFTAEVVNEEELAAAIALAIGDTNFGEEDLIIEPVDDDFVVAECLADAGDVIIDDRDQSNVCNNVVNIIIQDVQNPDVDNNQSATVNASATQSGNVVTGNVVTGTLSAGDVSNEQVVVVSNEQVVDIAQELNISPVIVQQCIQQNAGRDAIIGDDDNNNGGGTTGGTTSNTGSTGSPTGVQSSGSNSIDCVIIESSGTTGGTTGGTTNSGSNTSAAAQECAIIDTAPNKALPFTGGASPVVYYAVVTGFVLMGARLLGAGLGVWRARRT